MSAPRTVPGARFSCQGCGFCCRFHHLGPVRAETVTRLRESDPASWWPPAAGVGDQGWLQTRAGPTGPAHALRKIDGHCVFLDEDQRCAVHARLGAEAKPGFCRLFPFEVIEEADGGIAVAVRDSCAGLHHGGAEVSPQDVLALARAEGVVRPFAADPVPLLPGRSIAAAAWAEREAALLAWLATGPDLAPGALVAALRGRLADDLGPLPPPDPARAILATRAVLHALDLTLRQVAATEQAPSAADAAFRTELHGVVRQAGAALAAGEQSRLDAAGRAFVCDRLAHALLSKAVHRPGPLGLGLGRFLVPVTAAALVAAPAPGAAASLASFAETHAHLVRFTQNRSVDAVLGKAAPALLDLFLHAA